MRYKLIMAAALAVSAVLVASVGYAVATDSPWERIQERVRDGIQQQERDRLSRPEDAGSAAAGVSGVACGEALQLRSRVESGTPAARGVLALTRTRECASAQAQPLIARVRERVEASSSEKAAGETTQERVRAAVAKLPPAAPTDGQGADCPNPGQNCPDPDCPNEGDQQRERNRDGEGEGDYGSSNAGAAGSRNR